MSHSACRQVQSSIHDYLDGELPGASASVVEGHLLRCPECADLVRIEAAVRARIRQCCTADEAPAELRVRIMTRITRVVTEVRVTYRDRSDGVER